ncbi:hypothetical protein ACFWG0_34920 [Streptomyces yangpuensis]|uniref:hypothetical protein n=1 Tax=Streptomyces yangpuensis TaxID=1648182 RepID=UPI003652FEEE
MPETAEPRSGPGCELLAGPVHGTLAGEAVGPDGPQAMTLSVFGDGVVLTEDDGTGSPHVYRWTQVARLWCANDVDGSHAPDGMVVTQWVHALRMEFTDGTVFASRMTDPPIATPEAVFLSGRMSPSPPSAIAPLVDRIRGPVTALHLARARGSLAAGEEVEFGPLTATADGLRHDGKDISWHSITSCRYGVVIAHEDESELGALLRMEYRAAEGGAYGFPFHWLRIPALDVPDMDVLIGLVDENRT